MSMNRWNEAQKDLILFTKQEPFGTILKTI